MSVVNLVLVILSDLASSFAKAILLPFSNASLAALVFFSAVCGVVFLLIYGKLSFQNSIAAAKKDIHADLLEAILFRHDLKVSLLAQTRMLYGAVRYFSLAIPPLLILALPCIALMAQLDLRFGLRPFVPGESGMLVVKVKDPSLLDSLALVADTGLEVTPAVRSLAQREIAWRFDARKEGEHNLALQLAKDQSKTVTGQEIGHLVQVATTSTPSTFATHKTESTIGSGLLDKLLHPSSVKLTGSFAGIERINIKHPARSFSLFGIKMSWMTIFVVVSIAVGLLASKVFRIQV